MELAATEGEGQPAKQAEDNSCKRPGKEQATTRNKISERHDCLFPLVEQNRRTKREESLKQKPDTSHGRLTGITPALKECDAQRSVW